jgi:polar amino acid transport system permease protein
MLVILALFLLVPLAPGWDAVKNSFFNWEILVKTFPKLLSAFVVDLKIFLWSAPLIFLLSLAIALARNTRRPALFPLRLFGAVYTDVLRGVPVILLVYLIGFGIPGLGLPRPYNSPYIWGTVALVLGYSAYVAEVFRAGIESVHSSQSAAARSLGLTETDTLRYVVLPQAVRRQVPALMNFVIALLKDVALLSFIGPIEVLRQANVYKSLMANFTPYVGAAIIFLCVTIPVTRYADYLLAKQRNERTT